MNVFFLGYTGSMQRQGVANTSLAVTVDDQTLLVDVSGSPIQALKEAKIDPKTLRAVLLTHTHIDHLYALPSLLHQLWLSGRTLALSIVGNKATIGFAKELVELFTLEKKQHFFPIHWQEIEEGDVTLGKIHMQLFPVNHGVPTLGLSIRWVNKHLVYLADTIYTQALPTFLDGADILVHEAGGLKDTEEALAQKGHSSARQAAQCALDLKAKQLILVHLPEDPNEDELLLQEARLLFPATELPKLYVPY